MKSKYKCPVCDELMDMCNGDGMKVDNGVTVYCCYKECSTHENVYGHGSNEKNAWEIAKMKYGKKEKK